MKTKEFIKKIIKRLIIISIICTIILLIATGSSDSNMSQHLNSINYEVKVNKNGSMNVIETWDIDVSHTNTLFKTFDISNKYGGIKNVSVTDLTNNIKLNEIHNKMYHVTKDCYYGLDIGSRKYEIAWGIGMDNTSGRRKYQISYTVEDIVTDYKDCQEIYWQFLAKGENAIPARKVTGRVILPEDVSNIENLKVWGHGQINGKIEKVNEHEVYFELRNLRPKAMLEIRIITEDKMFNIYKSNKVQNYSYLNRVIKEETKWADESNEEAYITRSIICMLIGIYAIIIIINIFKIKKCINMKKQESDGLEKIDIKYYRDIPREDATPTEALYLYKFDKKRLDVGNVQKDAVAATILDLCLKKKIKLRVDEKEEVYIKVLDNPDGLKQDELGIYNLLRNVSKEEFNIEQIKKYAKREYNKYADAINKLVNSARNNLYKLELIDKANEKKYIKYTSASIKFPILRAIYEGAIITNILSYLPFFARKIILNSGIAAQETAWKWILILLPYVLIKLYLYNLQEGLINKIAVLTQKGSEEKEQWKALKRYMTDYSMISERKVPDLVLWEKYLVYGTAFGVADKVIEQMKADYPEVFIKENWNEEEMNEKYPLISFASNPIYTYEHSSSGLNCIDSISNNMSRAYDISKTEIASHSSSSGGGRWWWIFWRRRRPVVAEAGMGGR